MDTFCWSPISDYVFAILVDQDGNKRIHKFNGSKNYFEKCVKYSSDIDPIKITNNGRGSLLIINQTGQLFIDASKEVSNKELDSTLYGIPISTYFKKPLFELSEDSVDEGFFSSFFGFTIIYLRNNELNYRNFFGKFNVSLNIQSNLLVIPKNLGNKNCIFIFLNDNGDIGIYNNEDQFLNVLILPANFPKIKKLVYGTNIYILSENNHLFRIKSEFINNLLSIEHIENYMDNVFDIVVDYESLTILKTDNHTLYFFYNEVLMKKLKLNFNIKKVYGLYKNGLYGTPLIFLIDFDNRVFRYNIENNDVAALLTTNYYPAYLYSDDN